MLLNDFKNTLNTWGHQGVPFLFVIDFEMNKPLVFRLDAIDANEILFDINGFTNVGLDTSQHVDVKKLTLDKTPIPFEVYNSKFNVVAKQLSYGDSYLTNLTSKTEVKLNASLHDLFMAGKARYKLLCKNQFLVFSPEIFIQIEAGKIYSFPMKGTIDASLPNARHQILSDKKELAEHTTIVDLIRNDLSQLATNVQVTRFRYIDELKTSEKNLLQVSSEIEGTLPQNYLSMMGDILVSLLPAGSVSGAPKPKTLEIIKDAEREPRGYYTGVFGYFDGRKLDSGVMIRYIEKVDGKYFYRSGGGITTQSIASAEYQEMIDKVYVPFA